MVQWLKQRVYHLCFLVYASFGFRRRGVVAASHCVALLKSFASTSWVFCSFRCLVIHLIYILSSFRDQMELVASLGSRNLLVSSGYTLLVFLVSWDVSGSDSSSSSRLHRPHLRVVLVTSTELCSRWRRSYAIDESQWRIGTCNIKDCSLMRTSSRLLNKS